LTGWLSWRLVSRVAARRSQNIEDPTWAGARDRLERQARHVPATSRFTIPTPDTNNTINAPAKTKTTADALRQS